jgi:hypothetical protein
VNILTVLENILTGIKQPVLGMLDLRESIAVFACWYIWLQRREIVKGETIADPPHTAFAINALTSNYIPSTSGLLSKLTDGRNLCWGSQDEY